MKKIYVKLIVIVLELILAFSVVAVSSYAWMVLSNNPAADGIQIAIGGGSTILVAADLTQEVDGVVYHYPDRFQSTLNLGQHKSYRYLRNLAGLTPVSTADGINWFLPDYYNVSDPEVERGEAEFGALKPVEEFVLDDLLVHANLVDEEELIAKGSYIYLDFWVVSPGQDYVLRFSTGDDGDGSFVIGLPTAAQGEHGYVLSDSVPGITSSIRVGALVNSLDLIDNTMLYYQRSAAYSSQYTKLRGSYTEKGSGWPMYSSQYSFTIYEPNGNEHADPGRSGQYLITSPVGLVNGTAAYADIRDRLAVQMGSFWTPAEVGAGTQLAQRFQAAVLEPSFRGLTAEEAAEKFYRDYLGNQVAPYVTTGDFVKNTRSLYAAAETGAAGDVYWNNMAGATDDTCIVKLEKNIPQRIRLFIWIEGEDADCTKGEMLSSFAMQLELAGSNMEN